jgi:hypothetical protein
MNITAPIQAPAAYCQTALAPTRRFIGSNFPKNSVIRNAVIEVADNPTLQVLH